MVGVDRIKSLRTGNRKNEACLWRIILRFEVSIYGVSPMRNRLSTLHVAIASQIGLGPDSAQDTNAAETFAGVDDSRARNEPPVGSGELTRRLVVGVGRFELPASTSRTWRATKLRYTP